MKLRTRLRVIFFAIIIMPLLLTVCAFVLIGSYLYYESGGRVSFFPAGESSISESFHEFIGGFDLVYEKVWEDMEGDTSKLQDRNYLERIDKDLIKGSSYIVVRKGEAVFYARDVKNAEKILSQLPEYADIPQDSPGFFYPELERYVKQLDFRFDDGAQGSMFIISRTNTMISKHLLIDMFIAIVLILVFTSMMFTRGISKSIIGPVDQLNIAMNKIRDGDLDYSLKTDLTGEMGNLFTNYEDMRLRLKESAEEKKQHERENKELISNISHDLKTPITAIKGYVEGIMDGVADTPEKVDRYIKTIYNKANDMDKLINELTLYSGIDNNRMVYNYHKINVADYFDDCVEEVGLDLEAKGIELEYTNLAEPDTIVIADPEQMKKVVNNIISNSVKYMDKPKRKIAIRILDEVDSIRVEIEDNGKGIAQKDLQRIFERFYRTDTSRNSAQGGSGIGLSIVKKIIEDHGGYIWATSRETEGTCMHFVLRKYVELPIDKESEVIS